MTSRREFLLESAVVGCACLVGTTGCGGGVTVVKPSSIQREGKVVRLALDQVPELNQVGSSVKINGPEKILVVRATADSYVATSAKCTHGGAPLRYHTDSGEIRCTSFGSSRFELDGSLIQGAAKEPLPTYATSVEGSTLIIHT